MCADWSRHEQLALLHLDRVCQEGYEMILHYLIGMVYLSGARDCEYYDFYISTKPMRKVPYSKCLYQPADPRNLIRVIPVILRNFPTLKNPNSEQPRL